MLLIGLIEILFFFGLFVSALGVALWLRKDFKNGFKMTRALWDAIRHRRETPTDRIDLAERSLQEYQQRVGNLHESVARLHAEIEVNMKRSGEEDQHAVRAAEILREALANRNERAAQIAAAAKVNSEQRAQAFRAISEEQRGAIGILQDELQDAMLTYDTVHTKVDTIRAFNAITDARRRMYEILSKFGATGLTPTGTLDRLLDQSERDMVASGKLLELAKGGSQESLFALEARNKAREEVERMREAMQLGDGQKEEALLSEAEPAAAAI